MPLSPELWTILESNRPHEIEHFPLGIAPKNGLCGHDSDGIDCPSRPRFDENVPALRVRPPHANDRRPSAEPPEQRPDPINQIRWHAAVEVQLQCVHFLPSHDVSTLTTVAACVRVNCAESFT